MDLARSAHSVSGVPLSNIITGPLTKEAQRHQARKWTKSQTPNPDSPEPKLLDDKKAFYKVKKRKDIKDIAGERGGEGEREKRVCVLITTDENSLKTEVCFGKKSLLPIKECISYITDNRLG